ncbi:hypothetical protein B0G76_3537 [Paraburkholderia sp. BL23I1N1]|nr:hypothetical protein B0G76_3537 [Paraburkholderia sp. BL23I1N1]
MRICAGKAGWPWRSTGMYAGELRCGARSGWGSAHLPGASPPLSAEMSRSAFELLTLRECVPLATCAWPKFTRIF